MGKTSSLSPEARRRAAALLLAAGAFWPAIS